MPKSPRQPKAKLYGSQYNKPWRGLPGELRNKIYEHLLCPLGGIQLVVFKRKDEAAPQFRYPFPHMFRKGKYLGKMYEREDHHSCRYCSHAPQRDLPDRRHECSKSHQLDNEKLPKKLRSVPLYQNPERRLALARGQDLRLGMLRANKQAYREARLFVYTRNLWGFDATYVRINTFLLSLNPACRELIKDVRMACGYRYDNHGGTRYGTLVNLLTQRMKLRSITVSMPKDSNVMAGDWGTCDHEFLRDITLQVWRGKIQALRIHYGRSAIRWSFARFEDYISAIFLTNHLYVTRFKDNFSQYLLDHTRQRRAHEPRRHVLDDLEGDDDTEDIENTDDTDDSESRPEVEKELYERSERMKVVDEYKVFCPFQWHILEPEEEQRRVGLTLEMRIDIESVRAEMKRVEGPIERGKDAAIEEHQNQALRLTKPLPSLRDRLKRAKEALARFEAFQTVDDERSERPAKRRKTK